MELTQDEKDMVHRHRERQQEMADNRARIIAVLELATAYQKWLWKNDTVDGPEVFRKYLAELHPDKAWAKTDTYFYIVAILDEAKAARY